MHRNISIPDPPERTPSTPKSAMQAAIEETFSFDGPPDAMISVAGKVYLYFGGNGYFGLQADPEVLAATCEAVLRYGVGTATTRTAFTSPPVFEVERRTAEMLGTPHALYTASGYVANQILLESLEKTFDRIFIDEATTGLLFNAIKILHGVAASPIRFAHRDANDLKTQIDKMLQPHQRPLVLTDGVFFSQGTIAPLDEYDAVLAKYDGAAVLIDDSHGFGILGEQARGTLEFFGFTPGRANRTFQEIEGSLGINSEVQNSPLSKTISAQTPVRYYFSTKLSNAVGGFGGVLPGSEALVQRILERSRAVYEASPPPTPIAAATAKGIELLFERTDLRAVLKKNMQSLRKKLRGLGILIEESPLPIVTFQLGSAYNMRRIQRTLAQGGILITYLPRLPGLGPDGTLHLTVFATHTPDQLDRLVEALKNEL